MALLIRKTDNLRKSDGSEIIVNQQDPNDGILVRFQPQGVFKGFAQRFFLEFYSKLQFDQEGFGTTQIVKLDGTEIIPIIEPAKRDFPDFQSTMDFYDECVLKFPQGTHPNIIFAYGFHFIIKEYLEQIIGEDSVIIRLDLM
jgi:hypothetical protein